MKIKAISLWQPWATAWAIGLKNGETRGWAPTEEGRDYRGPLAIQAAKTERDSKNRKSLAEWFDRRMQSCPQSAAVFAKAGIKNWGDLPKGCVVGLCWLDRVKRSSECSPGTLEASWGNYGPGRSIWFPSKRIVLPEPIPCIGRQTIFEWEVPPGVLALPGVSEVLSGTRGEDDVAEEG